MSYSLLNLKTLPKEIYLAVGQIDYSQGPKDILDEEELVEYERITSKDRKSEFISTRQLVKVLSAQMGYLDSGFYIKKDRLGKPYGIADGEHIFLSIAHSSKYIVCGLSESRELGVDLEPVDREVQEGLKRRILHPEENAELKNLDLIQVWTIKEALVKLEGGGLRTNLNDVLVSKLDETEFSGRFNDDKTARICSFQHNEHWISVAYYQQ